MNAVALGKSLRAAVPFLGKVTYWSKPPRIGSVALTSGSSLTRRASLAVKASHAAKASLASSELVDGTVALADKVLHTATSPPTD